MVSCNWRQQVVRIRVVAHKFLTWITVSFFSYSHCGLTCVVLSFVHFSDNLHNQSLKWRERGCGLMYHQAWDLNVLRDKVKGQRSNTRIIGQSGIMWYNPLSHDRTFPLSQAGLFPAYTWQDFPEPRDAACLLTPRMKIPEGISGSRSMAWRRDLICKVIHLYSQT